MKKPYQITYNILDLLAMIEEEGLEETIKIIKGFIDGGIRSIALRKPEVDTEDGTMVFSSGTA